MRNLYSLAAVVVMMMHTAISVAASVEWNAKWISATSTVDTDPLPIFRRAFSLPDKPVRSAVIHICGLGQFELHINGKKVGDDLLQPGWTDYRKTCLYVDEDLTPFLHPGENVLGVLLGNGMYHIPADKKRYAKFHGSMGDPKLIAQLSIEFTDGTSQQVNTDPNWKTHAGPITFSSIYGGEDFDARLDPAGWDDKGFDESTWSPAVETTGPGGELRGPEFSAPSVKVIGTLKPVKITQPKPGVFVYDLGLNSSLMPRITVKGNASDSVKLTPAELLNPDGTIHQGESGHPAWFTYTLKGNGNGEVGETWSPRFCYYGSRWIQVTGAVPAGEDNPQHLPVIVSLEGLFISSSSPIVGEFSCSNELFNNTAKIIRRAMQSNMVSILTDCPHREKLGWLEQVHLVGPSMMYNFDASAFFTKMSSDMADAQTSDGLVPDIAPEYVKFNKGFRDSPEWGSACVLVPWQTYQWYGNKAILSDHYEMMKRYVAYLGTKATNHIVSHGLGDWYDLGPKPPGPAQLTPTSLTATAFYFRDVSVLATIARLLGHDDDAKTFDQLAGEIREAFNASLYRADTHSYATGSQCANAIPLVFNLAPEADRQQIVDNIVADIRKHDNGLTAGDVGYRYLLRALADAGRSDAIFDMNSRSDRPGYGWILAKGATTLTEAWDARPSSSQNHFMLGHIMEWFYSDLAGIQQAPDSIGYKKIVIRPTPVGDVTWAKASYQSVAGEIRSEWKVTGNRFELDVTIPADSTATVALPTVDAASIRCDGNPVATTLTPMNRSSATVPAGTHRIQCAIK